MGTTELRQLDRNGRQVGYRVVDGSGVGGTAGGDVSARQVVVLVHGWMTDGRIFDDLLAALEASSLGAVRWVIPDLAGHGTSEDPERYTLDGLAEDVVAVARHVAGDTPFVLVGHSMSGQVISLAAAQAGSQVKGLVYLSPVPVEGLPLPPDARGLFESSGEDREKQGTILGLACTNLDEAKKATMLDIAGAIPKATIAAVFAVWSAGSKAEVWPSIKAPALVVATDDPFLPPAFLREAYVRKLPRGRLAVLPGAGHYPQNERPRETAAILTAFFASLF
jgi:non-heme chloroperoxidase